jgi:hypothetical protein
MQGITFDWRPEPAGAQGSDRIRPANEEDGLAPYAAERLHQRSRLALCLAGPTEGDLILGLGISAIGSLVERTTRFILLLPLPRMTGHAHEARVKNGPARADFVERLRACVITVPLLQAAAAQFHMIRKR